jgi:hypothetical protein
MSTLSIEPSPDSKRKEEDATPMLTRDFVIASVKKCMIHKYDDIYFKPGASQEQDILDTIDVLQGMPRIPVNLVIHLNYIGAQVWLDYAKTHASLKSIQHLEKDLIRECHENPHISVSGDAIRVYSDDMTSILVTDKRPMHLNVATKATREVLTRILTDIVQYEAPSSPEDYATLSTGMQTIAKIIAQSIQWNQGDVPTAAFKAGVPMPPPNPRIFVRYTTTADFNAKNGLIEVYTKIYKLLPSEATDALIKLLS